MTAKTKKGDFLIWLCFPCEQHIAPDDYSTMPAENNSIWRAVRRRCVLPAGIARFLLSGLPVTFARVHATAKEKWFWCQWRDSQFVEAPQKVSSSRQPSRRLRIFGSVANSNNNCHVTFRTATLIPAHVRPQNQINYRFSKYADQKVVQYWHWLLQKEMKWARF